MNAEYSDSANLSDSSDEQPARVSRPGLGAGRSSGGTSFLQDLSKNDSSSSDVEARQAGLPSSFGGARSRVRKRKRVSDPSISQSNPNPQNQPLGNWERHTTGIGSKILAKHGFTGLLGARADGLAAPIQPILLRGKRGLGSASTTGRGNEDSSSRVRERDRATGFIPTSDKPENDHATNPDDPDYILRKMQSSKKRNFSNNKETIIDMRSGVSVQLSNMRDAFPSTPHQGQNVEEEDNKNYGKQEMRTEAELLLFPIESVTREISALTDTARAERARAVRKVDTEKMIMDTIKETSGRITDTANETETAAAQLQKVMDALTALSRHVHNEPRVDAIESERVGLKENENAFESALRSVYNYAAGTKCERDATTAATELATQRLKLAFDSWISESLTSGRAAKSRATHIRTLLRILQKQLQRRRYLHACGAIIVRPARRRLGSVRGVDIVRAACVADALLMLGDVVPGVVGTMIGEEIVTPRLVAKMKEIGIAQRGKNSNAYGSVEAMLGQDNDVVPLHLWIHPWVAVCGRSALSQPLGHLRMHITTLLEQWSIDSGMAVTQGYVQMVERWKDVLSKSKLQLALVRHIGGKLSTALGNCGTNTEILDILMMVDIWAGVCSTRLLAHSIEDGWMKGPARLFQKLVFGEHHLKNLTEAEDVYVKIRDSLSPKLRSRCRHLLAVLLFLLHAGRVVTDSSTRQLLIMEDVKVLADNRFRERGRV